MTKQELRKTYLEKRRNLSQTELNLRSRLICANFFSRFNLEFVRFIHVFLPIAKQNEPDTWLIIEKIRLEYPTTKILVPRIKTLSNNLEHVELHNSSSLSENRLGIKEPELGEIRQPDEVDMVLVPLLTFDLNGHRVGYGKGFYDRFLAECRPDTLKIGVSLFDGVLKIDDINSHDQPIHHCITPQEVVSF